MTGCKAPADGSVVGFVPVTPEDAVPSIVVNQDPPRVVNGPDEADGLVSSNPLDFEGTGK